MKKVDYTINSVLAIVIVLFASFTTSCSITERHSTTIQVLVPPTENINLPDSVSLAIVASIYNDSRTEKETTLGMPSDSALIANIAQELKEYLEDSPKYKGNDLEVYHIRRQENIQTTSNLSEEDLTEVIEAAGVDFLLSVEYVKAEKALYTQGRSFDEEIGYFNYVEMLYPVEAMFRIYDTRTRKVVDHNLIVDTLRIQAQQEYDESIQHAIERMPKLKTAMLEACQMLAESYISRISPHWENVRRYFYSDDTSDMDLAAMKAKDQKWKEATDIWLMHVDDKNMQRAAMSCFNLALASEMAGDYELAIEWLQQAKNKNIRFYSVNYETILQRRIAEKNKLANNF